MVVFPLKEMAGAAAVLFVEEKYMGKVEVRAVVEISNRNTPLVEIPKLSAAILYKPKFGSEAKYSAGKAAVPFVSEFKGYAAIVSKTESSID